MLLAINGTIIDTKNIYKISPIFVNKHGFNSISFTIIFFNGIEEAIEGIPISSDIYKVEDYITIGNTSKNTSLEEYNKIIDNYIENIKKFRNQIIEYYNRDNSVIPSINLFEEIDPEIIFLNKEAIDDSYDDAS